MNSPYGSGLLFFVRVRSENGRVLRVHVNDDVYRAAVPGARISQQYGSTPRLDATRAR
jgi:hypothetical protein